jgi:hypothetical protein
VIASGIGMPSSDSKLGAPAQVSGIYLDANMKLLTANVELTGKMFANGDFTITGIAAAKIGPLSGSETFTLSNTHANGFSFTGALEGDFKTQYIRGHVDAKLNVKISGGHLLYSGTATASGDVYVPVWGWEGGSLSAGIDNNGCWVKVAGHKVKFGW